jgi:hypothetical protein
MGEALVGAMVAAMRRANRDRAEVSHAAERKGAPRSEGKAWGYLAHPALMPTVYSPSADASDEAVPPDSGASDEEVAARKV